MRHLKIYENFNGIDDQTRDLFGLTYTLELNDSWGDTGMRIEGPMENKKIADEMGSKIYKEFGKNESTSGVANAILFNRILLNWEGRFSDIGYKITKWYLGRSREDMHTDVDWMYV